MSAQSLSQRAPTIVRPHIGSATLAFAAALYLIAITNGTFFARAYSYFDNTLAMAAFALGLTCLFAVCTITFSVKYLMKPLLVILMMSAAAASWFMDRFGTVIDVDMIRNAAETTASESAHLITPAFILHMIVFGAMPSLIICWLRVQHRPFLAKVKWNLIAILPLALIALACGVSSARSIASVTRLHRDLMLTLNPFVPIGNTIAFAMQSRQDSVVVAQPLGTDAHVSAPLASGKPRVLVIVVGETARAANFSLGGYARETNPELSKQDITYFSDTSSCGTATAVSVPCMFSNLTRSGYSHRAGLANQNVLDVLGHAGIVTEWWENNTGSKGVADRTAYRSFSSENDPRYCLNKECLDDGMIANLDGWLSKVDRDSVLVLHQMGSHGPAYYQRYPEAFARFKPECRTGEIGTCDPSQVVNTYDNTILYSDHIIAAVIDALKVHQNKIAPGLIYMSDHGESLGEFGLYLHGAPYIVAPSQQTHVPFVLWQGKDMKSMIDGECLSKRAGEPASHDNLFHTTLGMMAVSTAVYRPELDVLGSCRRSVNEIAGASS